MTREEKLQDESLKASRRTRKTDPLDMEVAPAVEDVPAVEEAPKVEESPKVEEAVLMSWIRCPTGKECPSCHFVILGAEMRKVYATCPKCGVALAE